MRKHGYVRIPDDSRVGDIESIAQALSSEGLEVSNIEIGKVTGQFDGTADEADIERIRARAASLGANFVPAEEDEWHYLPAPDSDLQ